MTFAGNIFNKYESENVLVKKLVHTYMEKLVELMKQVDYKNVLEVGCGEGYVLKSLKKQIDIHSPVLSDISHEILLEARILHPEIPLVTASVTELPFRRNQFDFVFAAEVLEHVEQPEEALGEIARVCNGYVLFSVPREPIWRLLNIVRLSYLRTFGNTPGHIQHWTSYEFKQLLIKYFDIVAFRSPFPWSMVLCQKKPE